MMTFKVGDVLEFVPERKFSWQPDSIVVTAVEDLGKVVPGVSHRYMVRGGPDDSWYSGWWFDKEATEIWDDGGGDDII